MTDSPRVLVTGASGFLASHVIHQLLESEEYQVRGTVRDINNERKTTPLYALHPNAKYPLELVQADLLEPDSWIRSVNTVHDFVTSVVNENEMLMYVTIEQNALLSVTFTHFDFKIYVILRHLLSQ